MSAIKQTTARPFAYNPQFLSDDQLRAVFIARQRIFEDLLNDISSSNAKSPPAHHLILGQRGMGKTTLLRRLGLELRSTELKEKFIPFQFAEEQYVEIDRLSRFWLNCLDSLADALEVEGETERIDELDVLIEELDAPGQDERDKEEKTRKALLSEIAKTGRRPVLFIDNFHLLLERLKDNTNQLRGFFSKAGAPILVTASTVEPKDFNDYGGAFYDGFKPRFLHRLSLGEIRDVLLGLAKAEGNTELANTLPAESGRLAALRDLTGGNPRTAYFLYEIFTEGISKDVFQDLERLLDGITPLYQSYLEQLNDLGQLIVGIMAREQRPMTALAITERGGLVRSSTSPQLGRLEDLGVVERVDLHGTKKAGYQVAERFFNLWYILRFSSRREKARVRCLAQFLEDFYSPAQTRSAAQSLMSERYLSGRQIEMALAMERLLGKKDYDAIRLKQRAHQDFIREMEGDRRRISELIDLDEIEPQTFEFAELKQKLADTVPVGASITKEEFVDIVLETPSLLSGAEGELDRASIAQSKLNLIEFDALVSGVKSSREREIGKLSEDVKISVLSDLRNGILQSWGHTETLSHWLDTFYDSTVFEFILTMASKDTKSNYPEHFEKKLYITRFGFSNQEGFNEYLLCDHLSWFRGMEFALRRELKDNPEDVAMWNSLGILLKDHLGRYRDAEVVYRKAILIDDLYVDTWNGLGTLFADYLGLFQEAERAYRKALSIDEFDTDALYYLGCLLHDHLDRHEEAEDAFRKVLSIDESCTRAWNNLGNLQSDYIGDYKSAQASYEKIIGIGEFSECAHYNLTFLLRDYLAQFELSMEHLNKAINIKKVEDSIALHRMLFAAYENNEGLAKRFLLKALTEINGRLPSDTRDDWYRAAAVMLHLSKGGDLIRILDSIKVGEKLLPFREAVKAHDKGERGYLKNIEPEARTVAESIYDQIDFRRKHLPESTRR